MEISIKWNICRVCLQEERKNAKDAAEGKMLQIFADDNKLVKQIYECSGVPMKQNDSLPDKICRKCFAILKYAMHFRKSCRDSNEYLLSVIQRTKSASSLFKQDRNTENLLETITDGVELDYNEDHDDLLVLGKCDDDDDVSNVIEKETKTCTKPPVHNKRKQSHKILQREKNMKFMEPQTSSSSSDKEPKYSMNDCENDDVEHEDIVDRIIEHEVEDDVEEIHGEIIEHSEEEPITQIINTDVDNSITTVESGAIHDDGQEENKCPEKLNKKDTKTNLQNTYSHFNKLDGTQPVVDCDEDEDEDKDIDDEKCSEAAAPMEDVKTEETDNTLYYIIDKNADDDDDDDATSEDHHHHHHNDLEEYVGSDDNVDFMPLEEEEQMQDINDGCSQENEYGDDIDNQGQVTSTVVTKEEIDIEDANSNMSQRTTQDVDAEYVIDEYVINECGTHDPLLHTNISIRAKNPKNTLTYNSGDVKGQHHHARRGNSVLGRKKLGLQNTNVASTTSSNTSMAAQQQMIVCELCGNNFTSRQLMNAHMKIHRQEKTHECELCFKRFITACNLQAHMRIHTGEKPYECKFCGRRFTDRSTHLRHERIHTNEKPFSCDHCGKAFALATTLQAHIKVHTGERPYRCEPCAKSFKLPHQLKAHQNTHLHKAVEQLCT